MKIIFALTKFGTAMKVAFPPIHKWKVVSKKGEIAYKVTYGPRRENIITLAVCNAAVKALDTLTVFQGKNWQTSWRPEKTPLKNIFCGLSESGWMTTEIFALWFAKFCDITTQRPLLLIFDGHLTHVSLAVIEKAMKENVFIIKFSTHVTHVLQPLDVTSFVPLKRRWEKALNSMFNEFRAKITMKKPTFVTKFCVYWYEGLSERNIVTGFATTGMHPVDNKIYPKKGLIRGF